MEAETTIKYPYGTTPEEVIRERTGGFDVEGYSAMHRFDPDALLTVLDDLYKATPTRNGKWADTNRSYKLRIQILAALGIDES